MIGWLEPAHLGALTASGVAAALIVRALVRPVPRLAPRVRQYAAVRSRTRGGVDVSAMVRPSSQAGAASGLTRRAAEWIGAKLTRLTDSTADAALTEELRQAGMFPEVAHARRAQEYRVRQIVSAAVWGAAGCAVTLVAGQTAGLVLLAGVCGAVFGATRWRGRVDKAIEDRRLRIRIELYTVNHLLAMHVRVGGGVVAGLQHLVSRGQGPVVEELAEVLAVHRGGRRASEALESAARSTVEPHAARTYRLLASGAEYGADLAEGLRTLSDDIRDDRTEALKRTATKRRAAMLVPTIAILAPVMLLFIAAPLPSIVFGGW
jgi:Flp pilus assembly protein TadB